MKPSLKKVFGSSLAQKVAVPVLTLGTLFSPAKEALSQTYARVSGGGGNNVENAIGVVPRADAPITASDATSVITDNKASMTGDDKDPNAVFGGMHADGLRGAVRASRGDEVGVFLIIKDGGIPLEQIEAYFKAASEYFELPMSVHYEISSEAQSSACKFKLDGVSFGQVRQGDLKWDVFSLSHLEASKDVFPQLKSEYNNLLVRRSNAVGFSPGE